MSAVLNDGAVFALNIPCSTLNSLQFLELLIRFHLTAKGR